MSAANVTLPPPSASVEALRTVHQSLPASPPPASSTATLTPSGGLAADDGAADDPKPSANATLLPSGGLAAPLGLANGRWQSYVTCSAE